jgi:protein-S-isoprenylcysteine O-methyltransferase Ste14
MNGETAASGSGGRRLEQLVRRIGAASLLVALGLIFLGLSQGLRRPVQPASGRPPRFLRRPTFYILASAGYFGICRLLWRPIAPDLSRPLRAAALALGALLYFPGLALVVSGRLSLGRMYFVSSSFGAQLYADHRLVTSGPFALVRHPMYLGILLTSLGGILLYRTWTFVFVALNMPGLVIRAWREEQALAAAFGEQWQAYCRETPACIPRIRWRAGRSPAKVFGN